MQKIRFETKVIEENQTLVLDKPAGVQFINQGAAGQLVTINQSIVLSPVIDFQAGAPFNPYSLNMPMNSRELDLTDYQIRFNNNVGR
jgi:hypothetical protein